MVTLTNRQTNYSFENIGETLKVTGTVSFTEDNRINNLNGSFQTLEGVYVGHFYYNENENKKSNRSISDIDIDKYEAADKLLDNIIKELKQQVA